MSGNPSHPDIEAVLEQVETALSDRLGADELRAIRDLLDDAAFLPQLQALLARRHNDPQIYGIPNTIARIMRKAEERRDEVETDRGWISTMAAGGGAALIVGSVIASLNPIVGVLALAAAAGGLAMAGTSWIGLRRLDKEKTIYRQIAERLAEVLKAVR